MQRMSMPGLFGQQDMSAMGIPTQATPSGMATAVLLIQVPKRNRDNNASQRKYGRNDCIMTSEYAN